jgi:hypothetical protein
MVKNLYSTHNPRSGHLVDCHPEVIHFICRAEPLGDQHLGFFRAARLATNLPLFPRRLQLPVLVNIKSVRPRLSRTIQGPKSQPESYFGCLSPEKQRNRPSLTMLALSSLFSFLSTAFFCFFAHFTIHSCEWSCSLPFAICIDDHGSFVICRAASVRPNHLSDQNFDHDY